MVDTGAVTTVIPRSILEGLGIRPTKRETFEYAGGEQVQLDMAEARAVVEGRETGTWVIFGEEGASPLLGAYTLEGVFLAVAPLQSATDSSGGFAEVGATHRDAQRTDGMNLALDIDEETAAKVSKIAAARDMTVEAMVAEYLTGIANSEAGVTLRKVQAAQLMETFERLSRDMGPRTWTRDDLYEERLGRYDR